VEGGQGFTLQNGEWGLEMKSYGCTGSLVADIQQKPHRKHLANCMSPYTPILVKSGLSKGQILPFEPVTALRKDIC